MSNYNFAPYRVEDANHLERVVKHCIETVEVSHFLIVDEWNELSNYFNKKLEVLALAGNSDPLYVISIFDVPNALNVIRSCIADFRDTISTASIKTYSSMPMLVRLHGAFPVVVNYPGALCAELGI